jgi:hypothetical protein
LGLHCGSAGSGEGDSAEFFVAVVMVLWLLSGERKWCERQCADESEKPEFSCLHDDSDVRLGKA